MMWVFNDYDLKLPSAPSVLMSFVDPCELFSSCTAFTSVAEWKVLAAFTLTTRAFFFDAEGTAADAPPPAEIVITF